MKLILPQIFENIIVCGDIHSDIMPLMFKINETLKLQNSLIIVAGDVGIGFNKDGHYLDLLSRASARLKKRNNLVLLLRGNHDNPEKWNDYEPFKAFWQDGDSNIRLIKDYTVICTNNFYGERNILCVGGAISIDRKPNPNSVNLYGEPWPGRMVGINYWPDEVFVYDESKVKDLEGITDVITHSAPDFCEPLIKNGIEKWLESDPSLKEDCDKERMDHTALYNKLREKNQIKSWTHGHFHFSNRTYINDTLFCLCGIMEFNELK